MNPAGNGMSFHKLDKAKDKNFWSVRVIGDIRLIVHKTSGSLLLCYLDHHEQASEFSVRPQKSHWIEQVEFPETGCGQNARATWSGHAARNQSDCGSIVLPFALPSPESFEGI